MVTYQELRNNPDIRTYIMRADASLAALGYTEHSFAHVGRVAVMAGHILETLGYSQREAEVARIAGWLHDIGNLINRVDHSQSGAVMAFQILNRLECDPVDVAAIVTAIGNHDEGTGVPVSPLAAALILADKSDVRRSRVREKNVLNFDIHDRVNYSVTESRLTISPERDSILLELTIDTEYGSVMDYFEIFTKRMVMCRKAAETLGLRFRLQINDQMLL